MSNSEKNSLLNPVGKVLCLAQTMTGETIGIAQVNASLAPVGSELFVQPSVGRLKLEVEVANENALHWQDGLRKANVLAAELRTEKYRLRDLLRATTLLLGCGEIYYNTQEAKENALKLAFMIEKELG